ncbi:hypothetical protein R6Q59_029149 [Mikania micrantha]
MITLLDSIYCEENHQWQDDKDEEPIDHTNSCVDDVDDDNNKNSNNNIHSQHKFIPEDLCSEHQELSSLISKESQQKLDNNGCSGDHRRAAVEWILKVVSHYSFTALTAVLAVNYLDRFVDRFEKMKTEKKPWVTQLAAVACLSLAAKIEETHVPLLQDLQSDGGRYIFEAKRVEEMEMLILSTLQWKMKPVTPLSFLDYFIRKLGLKCYLLIKRCECLLLCLLPDGRFRCYLPSVIATATMMHVISTIEPSIGTDFQSQPLDILGTNKEEVEKCRKEIHDVIWSSNSGHLKRKFESIRGSPDDVMSLSFSSDESWSVVNPLVPSSSPEPGAKKSRIGAA